MRIFRENYKNILHIAMTHVEQYKFPRRLIARERAVLVRRDVTILAMWPASFIQDEPCLRYVSHSQPRDRGHSFVSL